MAELCKTCKAEIVFAMTPSGASAPIDLYPVREGGNVLLLAPTGGGGGEGVLVAVVLSKGALDAAREKRVPLRLNHWATCPDRQEWRERTDAKREAASS